MKRKSRIKRFIRDIVEHTPIIKMIILSIALWMIFSAALYIAEREVEDATITSYGEALYWGIAAFSTAGIADSPRSGLSQIIGGIWSILGIAHRITPSIHLYDLCHARRFISYKFDQFGGSLNLVFCFSHTLRPTAAESAAIYCTYSACSGFQQLTSGDFISTE